MKFSHEIIQLLPLHRQQGSVLFVGLILMFILSVIGITTMRMTNQQERMAGNLRDQTIAFQAAEAALTGAEKTYFSQDSVTVPLTGAFTGSSCTIGGLKYCIDLGTCSSATQTPAPYLVAYGRGDGADSAFWKDTYKNYWATCGSMTGILFVDSSNYGKPGYPSQSPRYVIEQITDPSQPYQGYRITAIGYGTTTNAVVVLQATYSSQP